MVKKETFEKGLREAEDILDLAEIQELPPISNITCTERRYEGRLECILTTFLTGKVIHDVEVENIILDGNIKDGFIMQKLTMREESIEGEEVRMPERGVFFSYNGSPLKCSRVQIPPEFWDRFPLGERSYLYCKPLTYDEALREIAKK